MQFANQQNLSHTIQKPMSTFTKNIRRILPLIAVGVLAVSALPAFADTVTGASSGCNPSAVAGSALVNPLCASSLTDLLNEVLAYTVEIGSLFLTIMLIYVGFLFVAARGNEEKVGQARNALLWTVIGGLILLGASALAQVITATISNL
jgi:hypothetical protein